MNAVIVEMHTAAAAASDWWESTARTHSSIRDLRNSIVTGLVQPSDGGVILGA